MKLASVKRLILTAALALIAPVIAAHSVETAVAKDGYAAGDVVEVDVKGAWYPAKVMDVLADGVWIRFDGYNADYDNVFPETSVRKPKEGGSGKLGALAAAATKEATGVSIPAGGGKTSTASLPPLSRSGWKPPTAAAAAPADSAPAEAPAQGGRASNGGSAPAPEPARAAVQATLAVPKPHPGYPTVAFRLGDAVEVIEHGKWYPGIVTNMMFDARPFTVNMELYPVDRWWPTNEVRTVPGFPYATLPSSSSIGTDGAWKEGDEVEVQTDRFEWKPGVIVSVDGDNYDVYMPGGTGYSQEYYTWRHSDRIRNPGTSKGGWEEQPDSNGERAKYEAAIAASGCPGPSSDKSTAGFPFLWYYDHSFDRLVYGVSLYNLNDTAVTDALASYRCLGPVAAKFPNVASDGVPYTGAIPTSVLAGFLAGAEATMKKAMADDAKHALVAHVVRETSYEAGYAVPQGLPRVDGKEYTKKLILGKGAGMADLLKLVDEPMPYPWDLLEERYPAAQKAFLDYANSQSTDLTNFEDIATQFTLTDAKVEGLAKAANAKYHPGSTVLASKVDNASLTVIKDDYGVPTYRYKYAALLVKDPTLLVCNKVVWRYKEDYNGNGGYGAGYVDRFGAYEMDSVTDYCKCP